jgi:hypothetical protein
MLLADTRLLWVATVALAGAGIAWRDCVVIAAAGPLALSAFYAGMDASAPMGGLRAAIRCALAGIVSLLAAVVLGIVAMAALWGAWSPAHDHFNVTAWLFGLSMGTLVLTAGEEQEGRPPLHRWSIVIASVFASSAALLAARDYGGSLCAASLAVAVLMAAIGWRLLRDVASELLVAGR